MVTMRMVTISLACAAALVAATAHAEYSEEPCALAEELRVEVADLRDVVIGQEQAVAVACSEPALRRECARARIELRAWRAELALRVKWLRGAEANCKRGKR